MTRPTILVVEDETITAMALRASLEAMGYAVPATVATARDAIERAKTLKPDVVLMDIRLRGAADGISAAEAIRKEVGSPIVYLTAYSDPDTLRRARVTEPYGYIVKPYNENELRAVVDIAVHKGAMERARLAESELLSPSVFQAIIDVNPAAIYLKRSDGRIMYVNRRFEEHFGISRESAEGASDSAWLPQTLAEGDARAIRGDLVTQARELIRLPEGEREFLAIRMPLLRADKTVYGVCTILTAVDRAAEDVSQLNAELSRSTGSGLVDAPRPAETLARHHDALSVEAHALVASVRALASKLLSPGTPRRAPQAPPPEVVDITAIAEGVARRLTDARGTRVTFDIAPAMRTRADPLLMRVVLESLMENAVKFSANCDAPRVEVGRKPRLGPEDVFFVKDNGVGFEAAEASRLFEPFTKLHASTAYPGMGLGLSAVKSYVQAHGGRVWAEGKRDAGATFYFSLPAW